jgi:hypothetical protein
MPTKFKKNTYFDRFLHFFPFLSKSQSKYQFRARFYYAKRNEIVWSDVRSDEYLQNLKKILILIDFCIFLHFLSKSQSKYHFRAVRQLSEGKG